MALNIPSTSIRSNYVKKLKVGTVYTDPKTRYNYQVIEKKMNNSLVKVAVAYLGGDIEPILLQDVPEEYLKIDQPQKPNVMKLMKNKIIYLQEENKRLVEREQKSLYQRINELLDEKDNYYECDDAYYFLHSGLVIPLKKKYYQTVEEAMKGLDDAIDKIFKDTKSVQKTMFKQHSIQSNLYELLTCSKDNKNDVKDVLL